MQEQVAAALRSGVVVQVVMALWQLWQELYEGRRVRIVTVRGGRGKKAGKRRGAHADRMSAEPRLLVILVEEALVMGGESDGAIVSAVSDVEGVDVSCGLG